MIKLRPLSIPGLPMEHEKPYIPTHKKLAVGAKAMTIAAGFRCKDGVVLCADSELTMSGWLKFPTSKIRFYRNLDCQPAFTFAGDERFCGMLMDSLAHCIRSAEKESRDMSEAIEEECYRIHQKFAGERYEEGSAILFSLLVKPEEKKHRLLLSASEGIVHQVKQECHGTGRLPIQAMIAELFSPDLPLKQAALVATYMLAEAKTYGYGCGKDSNILLLYDDGSWTPFPDDPFYPNLKEIEQDYINLKRWLKPIIFGYSDLAVTKVEFDKKLESFAKLVRAARAKRFRAYADLDEAWTKWQEEQAATQNESPE